MDANDHIYSGGLGRDLVDPNGLHLLEPVRATTGNPIGPTFFRGSKPIDAVWISRDLHCTNATVLPVGYGVGDHRMFALDFTSESLLGVAPPTIRRVQHRRLTTRSPKTVHAYNDRLLDLLDSHQCMERLHRVYIAGRGDTTTETSHDLSTLDKEVSDYMRHAEHRCRKISNGIIPFTPEVALWIRRRQVYNRLLQHYSGKGGNRSNIIRAARRCGIECPFLLTQQELHCRISICIEKCKYFRLHGPQHRSQHLTNRLQIARDKEDHAALKRIQDIIQRERQSHRFAALRRTTGQAQGRSVSSVQVHQQGTIMEVDTEDSVNAVIISEVHNKRYVMANCAPICKDPLTKDFGHMSTVDGAPQEVLEGRYHHDSLDHSTADLFREIAATRAVIPANTVSTIITRQEWQAYWRKADERTSSSESGLHFGHYKAACHSDYISHYHAAKATVAVTSGQPPERWKRGVTVMLEKERGVNLVSKLRAILLMEADFNATNKMIFGDHMLHSIRQHSKMPEEIFSEKGRTAVDGTFAKVLFYDISRQFKKPAAIASVDASNCFDRICHAMASLVFQASGVPASAVSSMLGTIAEMKFFLRTAFGDSKTFAGGGIEYKTQGMCQGNGAAPAAWGVVSITLLNAHKQRHSGATFICPISAIRIGIAGILFVDDTDLMHMDMSTTSTPISVHTEMVAAIHNWGHLLVATGGALKPEKCTYTLIDYASTSKGRWKYVDYSATADYEMSVPSQDGSLHPITHLPATTAQKTLGIYTSPDGANTAQLQFMEERAQEWVTKMSAGGLPKQLNWLSMKTQFWPRIGYGIACSTATFAELTDCLRKPYFKALPLCGINRNIRADFRQLPAGFFGIGLPHPGIEATIESIHLLLQHFGCPTLLGTQLQATYKAFLLELGLSTDPLHESYGKYGQFCTHSWIKAVWERCWLFHLRINIPLESPSLPQEGDCFFMRIVATKNLTPGEMITINRLRLHQQVLFLSDILAANGKNLDERYWNLRKENESWSTYTWPKAYVSNADVRLWREVLSEIAPICRLNNRLGAWIATTHKRWEWTLDPATNKLYQQTPQGHNRYGLSTVNYRTRRSYHYILEEEAGAAPNAHHYAQVRWATATTFRVLSSSPSFVAPAEDTSDFRTVLASWGGEWMWEHSQLIGPHTWIAAELQNNTLHAATDGSYMRHLAPNTCAAAFILECTAGSGRYSGVLACSGPSANAYRGELLGLLAINLIIRSVCDTMLTPSGQADVYCDCLGAINRVTYLPRYRIPSRTKHADILKVLLTLAIPPSVVVAYHHVTAHQDDLNTLELLPRPVQLNCQCDRAAKVHLLNNLDNPMHRTLPRERISLVIDSNKVTLDSAGRMRHHIGRQLARQFFHSKKILTGQQFDKVDWDEVSSTLESLPKMFQLWAAKHVTRVAGTMDYLRHQTGGSPLCPSCMETRETTFHITRCLEKGRQAAMDSAIQEMNRWLSETHTDPYLQEAISGYLHHRGRLTWAELMAEYPRRYWKLGVEQDMLGWDGLLLGMVSKEVRQIQSWHLECCGSRMSVRQWMHKLITQLLQITHGQWVYRNEVVHNATSGANRNAKKQRLQERIDLELTKGLVDLRPEDHYLMALDLEDLDGTSGEQQEYWLLAVEAARTFARREGLPPEGIG